MISNKTFRLFISSTFSDLVEERNILQNEVFPEIKAYCKLYGYGFEPIDLRWGVSSEAGLDHKTMEICIKEVEKVFNYPKPNFLIMLGNRYGWIPVPTEIEDIYFDELKKVLKVNELALLNKWYVKDTNIIPAQYILQPIDKVLSDEEKQEKVWQRDEKELVSIILEYKSIFPKELYIGKSATEQEIIRGVLKPARTIQHDNANVLCMVREIENIGDVKDSIFLDVDQSKLDALKTELKKCDVATVEYKEINAKFVKKENVLKPDKEYLEDYAILVKQFLQSNIKREIDKLSHNAKERESKIHERFMLDRAKVFIGRSELIEAVNDYISNTDDDSPFVIYGESGVGKSALMAKIIKTIEDTLNSNTILLYRFVGISEISSQPKFFLDNLIVELEKVLDLAQTESAKDYSSTVNRFISLLNKYSEKSSSKLILIIDALDQFETKSSLEWIEAKLPQNIKIIVSTLPSEYGEYFNILKTKVPSENIRRVEKLDIVDARKIIESWLEMHHKSLTPKQFKHILTLFEHNGLPLYLKIIFDQALTWRSYNEAYKNVTDKNLSESIRSFFKNLVLEKHHSQMLVEHTLGYLSASKSGLSESEIVEVLSSDHIVMQDISNPFHKLPSTETKNKLPAAVWSRLYHDLLKYFTFVEFDGLSLLNFYHRKIKENSRDFYYLISKEYYHTNLLEYFWNQPLIYTKTKDTNLRKLSELPYHCIQSKAYSKFRLLYTVDFIKEKINNAQKENMLNELFEISSNLLDNQEITETYKDELISKLVHMLFSYLLTEIQNTSSKILSVEDIHAVYTFKTNTRFYKKLLEITSNFDVFSAMDEDAALLKSYTTAFKARKGNILRREAKLKEASDIYAEMISSNDIKLLDNLEQSTILYDVGAIAYLRADSDNAVRYLQESADVAGDLNEGISRDMSMVKLAQVKFVYYHDFEFFESVLDNAFEKFWKYRLSNLSARRFVKNIYALYFDLYYATKQKDKAIEYLDKFKSDSTSVYKSIYYMPKDTSLYKTTGCTGYTPYEARIKILEGKYDEAADMFKSYLNDFLNETDRTTLEFVAKEYYDYLIALKKSARMDEYKLEYENALELPDEPINAIWKKRIRDFDSLAKK